VFRKAPAVVECTVSFRNISVFHILVQKQYQKNVIFPKGDIFRNMWAYSWRGGDTFGSLIPDPRKSGSRILVHPRDLVSAAIDDRCGGACGARRAGALIATPVSALCVWPAVRCAPGKPARRGCPGRPVKKCRVLSASLRRLLPCA